MFSQCSSVLMKLLMPQRGGEECAMRLFSRPHLFLLTLVLSSLTKEKGHKDPYQPGFLGISETLFWRVLAK